MRNVGTSSSTCPELATRPRGPYWNIRDRRVKSSTSATLLYFKSAHYLPLLGPLAQSSLFFRKRLISGPLWIVRDARDHVVPDGIAEYELK
jgi:hypothetical protein